MNAAVVKWLLGTDTGASSRAIVAWMERDTEYDPEDHRYHAANYPHDPSDLGRCIRLLNIAPDYRARIAEMGLICPEWNALASEWASLEYRYLSNAFDKELQWTATYSRMRELLAATKEVTS